MGATDGNVDVDKFASEIELVFRKILDLQPTINIQTSTFGIYCQGVYSFYKLIKLLFLIAREFWKY